MAGPLVVCPSCSTHVLVRDTSCPHCGAKLRSGNMVRSAGAVLMGLALAGCPAGDDSDDTLGGTSSDTSSSSNGSTSMAGSTTADNGVTGPTFDESGVQSAYGSPDSETFGTTDITDSDTTTSTGSGSDTDTDTDTDTDAGSSSGTTTSG